MSGKQAKRIRRIEGEMNTLRQSQGAIHRDLRGIYCDIIELNTKMRTKELPKLTLWQRLWGGGK